MFNKPAGLTADFLRHSTFDILGRTSCRDITLWQEFTLLVKIIVVGNSWESATLGVLSNIPPLAVSLTTN